MSVFVSVRIETFVSICFRSVPLHFCFSPVGIRFLRSGPNIGRLFSSWIQLKNPSIVVALKWLLFGCLPFIALTLFTLATISAVGMHNAIYYFMTFNCIFYWLFGISHASSFKAKQEVKYHGAEAPDDNFILSPLESCFHALNLLFFPLVFHVETHHLVVLSSAASVCELFMLFFIPFLFLLYASPRGAL